MIHTLLVALDGSKAAEAGLRVAADWAGRIKAQLVGCYIEDEQRFVYYPPTATFEGGIAMPVPLPEPEMARQEAAVAAEGAAIRAEFDRAAKGVPGRFVQVRGDVNTLLVQQARSADLVVVGKRGHFDPPASRKAGPTTEALIHDALRPVLVVPEAARTAGPLLVAFDDSKGVQRVLPTALDLSRLLKLEMAVLTVDDKPDRGRRLQEPLLAFASAHGITPRQLVEPGKPAEVIVRQAEKERAGLIVMGAFNRNPVYEWFFGSTTLNVLERAACPVLLMA
jgi:nucleotide-binding universal stress UspA family protein